MRVVHVVSFRHVIAIVCCRCKNSKLECRTANSSTANWKQFDCRKKGEKVNCKRITEEDYLMKRTCESTARMHASMPNLLRAKSWSEKNRNWTKHCTHLGHFKFNGISIGTRAFTFYCTKKYTWQCDHFGLCANMSQWQRFENEPRKTFLAECVRVCVREPARRISVPFRNNWLQNVDYGHRMVLTKSNCLCARMCNVCAGRVLRLSSLFLSSISISLFRLFSLAVCLCAICMQMRPIRTDPLKTVLSQYAIQGVRIASMGSLFQIKSFWNCCKPIVCFVRRFVCVMNMQV